MDNVPKSLDQALSWNEVTTRTIGSPTLWGNEFLPWYKIKNVGLLNIGKFPVRFESFEHAIQFTNEYEEGWTKLVNEKERRNLLLGDAGRPTSHAGSIKPASLYGLVIQFASHKCLVPRDKVIGLLGLVPDNAAHLADYSTPIHKYFLEVCKYAFTTAPINGEWAKTRFQRLLGESLGLSASEYSVHIELPGEKEE
ncbi:hypothetical protein OIDMADRAFT_33720 [Oidiodendron maius Zn]|uniref:Uncharacterized protein n=1 Tax=Oidiodendron maius (strain Zn) TaxID=913774 RepID=A0A0C3GHL9_OIDMZ|nr:hypothetical protein OIDMADRAFT_33720 [Oidiodendron maius Zn]